MFDTVSILLRGFVIDLTGKPQVVLCEKPGKMLPGVMKAVVKQNEGEENIAGIIRKAYNDLQKFAGENDGFVPVPSCVALFTDEKADEPTALYWIDENIDAAKRRMNEKNTTPKKEIPPAGKTMVKPEERAAVVKNRVALVTGGAQGIGEEIVKNLAAAGALVFIADLNLQAASELAKRINCEEDRTAAIALAADVCNETSVKDMFNSILQTTGGFDLCVSNAGVLKAGSVLEQPLDDFKFVTDVNYTGFFIVSKYAARILKTQFIMSPSYFTDIIQINSKSGLAGSSKNGAYAGGKFGGLGLVTSFALELAEYNIKVNAICPGNFFDGPLWTHPENGLFVQYLKAGKVPGAKTITDVRSFYEAKSPMKRGCTGKDLMRSLFYIVEQEYETGQAVPVTGGQIMLH